MGVVYRAGHRELGHEVALKMILSGGHAGAEERARFRLEAAAVARLHHPGIVHIHEFGEHDGSPFFSLELLTGGAPAPRPQKGPPSGPPSAPPGREVGPGRPDRPHGRPRPPRPPPAPPPA